VAHLKLGPDDILDRSGLKGLDLKDSTISREIREGRLKSYRRAGKDYFLGSDLLDWIKGGKRPDPVAKAKSSRIVDMYGEGDDDA
jgi:hypothetical protein